MKLNTVKKEDLRGVFFIIKGQYRRNLSPSFINRVTNTENFLGGYDPESEDTLEWYMLVDNITFNCITCGNDLNKIKDNIVALIKTYKTKDRYLKGLEQKDKRSLVSEPMRCLYEALYNTYGDYFADIVEEMEDLAYSDVEFKTPLQRSKDIKRKTSLKKLVTPQSPKEEVVEETPVLKKRLLKKRTLKKLTV